jgi:dihydroorotate dehydrogenase (NAD+) catalytic subunit
MGAFITNPVSLRPRTPAQGPRLLPFPGGFLLHSGNPNPGLRRVIQLYAGRWARSPLPVVVHLLAESPAEVSEMAERLERVDGVAG